VAQRFGFSASRSMISYIRDNADRLFICTTAPASYSAASTQPQMIASASLSADDWTMASGTWGPKLTLAAKTITPEGSGTASHLVVARSSSGTVQFVTDTCGALVIASGGAVNTPQLVINMSAGDGTATYTGPVYVATGTVLQNATLAGTHSVDVPAHDSGDLLLLLVGLRNNNNDGTLSAINTAGWTQFSGNTYGGTQGARMAMAWKIGDGVESSVSITATGGATTDQISAIVHRFTSPTGFRSSPVVGIAIATAAVTAMPIPTLTIGAQQLAVASYTINGSAVGAECAGETGGDWIRPVADEFSPRSTIGIHICSVANPTTLSGGTVALHVGATEIALAFALVPA
jgi:hypothetical protein